MSNEVEPESRDPRVDHARSLLEEAAQIGHGLGWDWHRFMGECDLVWKFEVKKEKKEEIKYTDEAWHQKVKQMLDDGV